jgi:ribosome-binding factor A
MHSTAHSMGNRRTAKVAEAIREVVSSSILFELRDPRIGHVTVLGVEVPGDLRTAKVRVSVMGTASQQRLTMAGLAAARGYLQGKVADRLALRFAPILSFEIDESVKKSAEASRILRQLAVERAEHEPPSEPGTHPVEPSAGTSPDVGEEGAGPPVRPSPSQTARSEPPGEAASGRPEDG